MCIIPTCKKYKTYNLKGLKPEYCAMHKTDDMIDVRHERCTECRFQASFGYESTNIREKCSIHASKDMINLKCKNIICIGPSCTEARGPKLNGYCSEKCYINNNLQDYIYDEDTSHILYKEYLIFKHLKMHFNYNIIWNKVYCGAYRPDFRISFDTFNIIIELDENQHIKYDKQYELERIENIYHMIQEPLFVIRFNPDKYTGNVGPNPVGVGHKTTPNPVGIKVKSPFKNNKLINEDEWNNRLITLRNEIHKCIEIGSAGNTTHTYSINYLFYNETV